MTHRGSESPAASAASLPAAVRAVCATWLAAIDERAPGLVNALYLRGGLAFGEWIAGTSDIDFVAVLAARPDDAVVERLRAAHEVVRTAHPEVAFDGAHVTREDLSGPPDLVPDVPCTLHGLFEAESRSDLNIVAWHELAERGITVRGEPVVDLGVWTDAAALAAFTRGNLDTYWRDNAAALAAMPEEGATLGACCWCVLGVARLHHLLVTEALTTKSGAGRWGLGYYPERFHRVLREALRIREGGIDEYVGADADRGADTAAFTAHVVAAGAG